MQNVTRAQFLLKCYILTFSLLGLFYSGIENNIMAERSFNEASKILHNVYSKVDVEKEEIMIGKNLLIAFIRIKYVKKSVVRKDLF